VVETINKLTTEKETKMAYQAKPNTGALFSVAVKKNPKSPDYTGDIVVSERSVNFVDGVATIKLAGWKKTSGSGKTFLSLSVSENRPAAPTQTSEDNDDPFK
jgi:hypothetical protein